MTASLIHAHQADSFSPCRVTSSSPICGQLAKLEAEAADADHTGLAAYEMSLDSRWATMTVTCTSAERTLAETRPSSLGG
jgi:hypothetical protein